MAHTPQTITVRAEASGPVTAKAHCGGFIEHGAEGPKAILLGFVTEDGRILMIPREVFDTATVWIAERESSPESENA